MTWTKLGDEFGDECWTLTDQAFRLHTEGLCWSNRMTTDGQLAKEDMRRWARHPEAAEELVCPSDGGKTPPPTTRSFTTSVTSGPENRWRNSPSPTATTAPKVKRDLFGLKTIRLTIRQ